MFLFSPRNENSSTSKKVSCIVSYYKFHIHSKKILPRNPLNMKFKYSLKSVVLENFLVLFFPPVHVECDNLFFCFLGWGEFSVYFCFTLLVWVIHLAFQSDYMSINPTTNPFFENSLLLLHVLNKSQPDYLKCMFLWHNEMIAGITALCSCNWELFQHGANKPNNLPIPHPTH